MSKAPRLKPPPRNGSTGKPHPELIDKKKKAKKIANLRARHEELMIGCVNVCTQQVELRKKRAKAEKSLISVNGLLGELDEVVENHTTTLAMVINELRGLGVELEEVDGAAPNLDGNDGDEDLDDGEEVE